MPHVSEKIIIIVVAVFVIVIYYYYYLIELRMSFYLVAVVLQ
jgi:hypothetical protein